MIPLLRQVNRLLGLVVVSGAPGQDTVEQRREVMALRCLLAIAVGLLVPFGVSAYLQGNMRVAVIDLSSGALLTILAALYRRRLGYAVVGTLCTLVVAALFLYLLASGGVDHTGFLWSYLFPMAALFLMGPRVGVVYSIVYAGMAATVCLFAPAVTCIHSGGAVFAGRFLGSLLGVTAVAYVYEYLRVRTQSQILAKQEELQQALGKLLRAQEALRHSEEKHRNLVERSSDGVLIVQDGLMTYVNPTLEKIAGFTAADLIDRPFGPFLPPEERQKVADVYRRRMAGEPVARTYESALVHRDGSRIDVEISGGVIEYEGKPADLVLVRDIRERKRAEQEKRQLREELYQARKLESVGRLAGGIAHDFNNILGAIAGYADMLRMRFGAGNKDLERYARAMLDAAKRAADLTSKLLAFARKGKFEVAPTNMHHVIEDAVNLLKHSIDKRINIRCRLDATATMVMGDRTQLQNAVINLGLNACDAMPQGGELRIESENLPPRSGNAREPARLCVRVSDTGVGMAAEAREHAFEPFFSTKDSAESPGLGLASVYGTVKSHDGTVSLESEVGKGTTVILTLPVVEGMCSPQPAPSDRVYHGTGTIMLVDDEQAVRDVAADILRNLGYTPVIARDGEEAEALLAGQPRGAVNLAFVDLVMPGMGGRECIAALRRIDPGLRIVVTSGYPGNDEIDRLLAEGAVAFVQKPFDIQQFSRVVHNALAVR